jgi:hypothetical protein
MEFNRGRTFPFEYEDDGPESSGTKQILGPRASRPQLAECGPEARGPRNAFPVTSKNILALAAFG